MSGKTDKKIGMGVELVNSVNMSSIFVLFMKDSLKHFLDQFGRFFMFPLAALASVIVMMLAWRDAARANDDMNSVLKAVVETVATIATLVAVVGGFVGGAAFAATVVPLIFVGGAAFKTLFSLGSAIYFGVRAALTEDKTKKAEYKTLATYNAIGTVAGIFATVAIVGAMILAKPIMGILGIVASAIGAVITVKMAVNMYKQSKAEAKAKQDPEKEPLLSESNDHANEPEIANDVNFNAKQQNVKRLVSQPAVRVANEEFAQHKVSFGVFSRSNADKAKRHTFSGNVIHSKPALQNV